LVDVEVDVERRPVDEVEGLCEEDGEEDG